MVELKNTFKTDLSAVKDSIMADVRGEIEELKATTKVRGRRLAMTR